MFSISPGLIYHAAEVKSYSLDVAVALLLVIRHPWNERAAPGAATCSSPACRGPWRSGCSIPPCWS
jgi:hypothetical protein